MKSQIQKDHKIRRCVAKNEVKRRVLKALLNDLSISLSERSQFAKELNSLPRNASKTRIVNRCILTGRSHSVYRFCRLSRLALRELISKGLVPGYTKRSW